MKLERLLVLVFLLLLASILPSCSDPGTKYQVEVTDIDTLSNLGSPYCAYKLRSVDTLIVLPRNSVVAHCGTYQVGDVFETEINDNK